eukprot:TRINITY_DN13550_c0_g1_i1.p1 TRINITY_DN13550_c0_g1~~TRINITY_DN13550_c0_g1_i1.p1  ORF type:complete len:100 (+),score=11.59 TRINITY_DN13550_c0_g1_i1:364-663(+)
MEPDSKTQPGFDIDSSLGTTAVSDMMLSNFSNDDSNLGHPNVDDYYESSSTNSSRKMKKMQLSLFLFNSKKQGGNCLHLTSQKNGLCTNCNRKTRIQEV